MKATFFVLRAAATTAISMVSLAGCGGDVGDPERLAALTQSNGSQDAPALQRSTGAAGPFDTGPRRGAREASQATPPAPGPDASGQGRQLAALQEEVARLRQRVAALESALGSPNRPANAGTDLESRFRAEAAGSQWSRIAHSQVTAAFSRLGTDPEVGNPVRAIECRASICKVETTPEGEEVINENLGTVFGELGGSFSKVVAVPIDEDTGRPASIIYFYR
jgi:hypothetical protein